MAQSAGPANGTHKHHGAGKQSGERGERGAAIREALESLNLTADQKKEIAELNEKFKEAVKELRDHNKDSGGAKGANREKMGELMKAHMKEVMEVLTPEQRKEFKSEMKSYRGKEKKEKSDVKP